MDFKTYLKESTKPDVKHLLIQMFKTDKLVTIKELEEFAKENDIDYTQVQYILFEFLHNLLYRKQKGEEKFDKKELEKGIEDEMEHTKDRDVAESIAKDHLRMHKNYYSVLDKAGL